MRIAIPKCFRFGGAGLERRISEEGVDFCFKLLSVQLSDQVRLFCPCNHQRFAKKAISTIAMCLTSTLLGQHSANHRVLKRSSDIDVSHRRVWSVDNESARLDAE